MPFEKGDFVLLDFTARVKETGEVFDTTKEDVAKKEKLYKEGQIYEPNLIVIGEGWVLRTLDESLPIQEPEKTASVEIPPEKAFGNREPEKVRLVPLKRLMAKGITPQLGMRVEYEGKLAIVRTLGAGRVQLDFNPPLAGKTLVYEVTVRKKLETEEEKINALIHRRIPSVDVSKFEVKNKKTTVEIEVPEEAFYIEGLQAAKRGIAIDIQKFFAEKDTVAFTETFKKIAAAAEKTTLEQPPVEQPKEAKTQLPQTQPTEAAETS
jgi:FKBP-type peptidyl-prolyl cis-trans isomerase 2